MDRARPLQYLPFVRHEPGAPGARRALVFSHRAGLDVELLDRLGVRVLLDAGDEAFERFG